MFVRKKKYRELQKTKENIEKRNTELRGQIICLLKIKEKAEKELEITRRAIKSAESALEKREEETRNYFEKLMSIRNFIEKTLKYKGDE